jgi:hypothetical protein
MVLTFQLHDRFRATVPETRYDPEAFPSCSGKTSRIGDSGRLGPGCRHVLVCVDIVRIHPLD